MTEEMPRVAAGEEYVVLYLDGPNEGQLDRRVAHESGWDQEISVYVAVDATETQLRYAFASARKVGDQVHVCYRYEPGAGDPIEDLEDRGAY